MKLVNLRILQPTAQVFMNEENIADVHAEVDGPGTFSLTASCSRFSNDTNNL